MESSRSSVLKGLAVAFGDGLAFGVGVKLSSTRPWERRTSLGSGVLPEGAAAFDARVLKKVIAALEARIEQQGAQVDRKLAEVEAAFALELKGFDERRQRDLHVVEDAVLQLRTAVAALPAGPDEEVQKRLGQLEVAAASMRTEVEAGARKADEIARRVPDLATAAVEARLRELVPQLQAAVASMRSETEAATRRVDELGGRLPGVAAGVVERRLNELLPQFEAALASVRAEVEAGSRRADEMNERLADLAAGAVEARLRELLPELERRLAEQSSQTDRNVQELLTSVAGLCEQAAQRIAGPAAEPPSSGCSSGPEEPVEAADPAPAPAAGTSDMFATRAPAGPRRVLLVSSFVIAAAALACFRLLV